KAFTWWHTRAVADGLYSREEPYGGAAEALNQLHDAGWNVIMATSRADDWRGESQRWLHRNGFRFDGYYNGDKTLLTPDALIDDRPVTLEAMAAKGVTAIHPDHAYCTAAPGRMFRRWAAVPLILEGVR
ncbi:5' nucleotidase, NT5C type, partial [Bifidobacterium longum]